jgi:hypothetical protein
MCGIDRFSGGDCPVISTDSIRLANEINVELGSTRSIGIWSQVADGFVQTNDRGLTIVCTYDSFSTRR